MEDAVPVRLQHFRVGVETRISKLGDLLCEQFDPVCRIAKDNRLVNLQLTGRVNRGLAVCDNCITDLGKECVKTVDLLTFLNEGIILCNTTEG